MRFLEPRILYLLLLVPVFYFFFIWDEKKRLQKFSKFADRSIWHAIAPELFFSRRLLKAKLWIFAFVFLVLAMARPQWGTHEETAKMTGLDIAVLLDVSNSMEAEDVVPSRLKKAKHAIRTLVERLRGDRVGLVAFAGSSYVACPLTTDLDYFLQSVEVTSPDSVINQGTDIGTALETAARLLDRGAEEATHDPSSQLTSRVVIVITDGEDHENEAVAYAAQLKKTGTKVYVLGVGTQKGAPIPMRDASGNLRGHKRDSSGQPIVTKMNPDALVQIATASGGRYWTLSEGESEVDELLGDVGGLNRTEFAERKYVIFEDRFQFPLAVAIILLLIEMGLSLRKMVRGSILGSTSSVIMLAIFSENVLAAPLNVYLENEKGIQALQDGKLEEAKKSFGSAQARAPKLPELHFNQGVVHSSEGNMDAAIENFGTAAQSALESKNLGLAGRSYFNMGVGYSKKGDVKNSVESYLKAIEYAKAAQDSALENDARKNIELLKINPPQQQKNQEDQKKEDKNNKNQEKQNQEQNQEKENQKKNESSDQAKKYEQPKQNQRQRDFKSKKLNADDAERVMAQLKNKEKELQSQLKKQKVKQQQNGKDW